MKRKNYIGRVVYIVLLVIVLIAIVLILEKNNSTEIPNSIAEEIEEYNETANEEGISIIDMDSDPYFIKKQSGVDYAEPITVTYNSKVTNELRKAMVLLPYDYSEDKEYPVLYLLHGLEGNEKTWIKHNADIIIQNLIYFEKVPEMIVVFPDCMVDTYKKGNQASLNETVEMFNSAEEDITYSLAPYIDSNYNTKSGKNNRAIAGFSMGGRNALYIAFSHQNDYGYIGAFSPANVIENNMLNEGELNIKPLLDEFSLENEKEFRTIMICVGKQDAICKSSAYAIHANMKKNNIDHIFYDAEGEHDIKFWNNALYNFLKKVFK